MVFNSEDFIKEILKEISTSNYIKSEDIPNIELYMDQITTFMDSQLENSKRYKEDKILTKTMINNYTKNNLLPPPNKKKYSKEHILMLIFIYYFKNILSITDIQALLHPISERYFSSNEVNGNKEAPKVEFNLKDIYDEIISVEKKQIDLIYKDIMEKLDYSRQTFQNNEPDDQEYLQLFSFICMLSFDVYLKKQLIERLVDKLPENNKNKNQKGRET